MTTEPNSLTDKLVAQETTLPCGCVIRMVRTIESFTDVVGADSLDDFCPELTFCPLHKAAENLRGNLLGVKADMEAVSCVLNDVKNYVSNAIEKTRGEPHE